jgi:hypothetical protein
LSWIEQNIFWILIVCGVATCSMIAMALAPRSVARLVFDDDISNPSALLIARSWGAMIFVSGVLLIASAYHPAWRTPVLLGAIAGKLGFVLLVFANSGRYLSRPAFAMAIGDLLIVLLLVWYLAAGGL